MGDRILPLYLIAAISPAARAGALDALDTALSDLSTASDVEPVIGRTVRLAVLVCADTTEVVLELSDLTTLTELPGATARGSGIDIGGAFETIERTLTADLQQLRTAGSTVLRPAVFFVCDCEHSAARDWGPACRSLRSRPWAPDVAAFGFGDADAHAIARIGTVSAFMADPHVPPARAFSEFVDAFVLSVVRSGDAAARGRGSLVVRPPDHFTAMPLQAIRHM